MRRLHPRGLGEVYKFLRDIFDEMLQMEEEEVDEATHAPTEEEQRGYVFDGGRPATDDTRRP